MTVTTYTSGRAVMLPGGWEYDFWSPSKTFSIPRVDPSVVMEERSVDKPLLVLDKSLLKTCLIDADVVGMMLRQGAVSIDDITGASHHFRLIAVEMDGKKRPVWDVDYRVGGKKVYVFADTGEVVYREGNLL